VPARKGLRPRFVVIPTNGRACLKDSLMAIQAQVDSVILVYTAPYVEGELRVPVGQGIVLRDLRKPPNISRWWNQGLHTAKLVMDQVAGPREYDVAVINDDVIVPPGWFDAVSDGMRAEGAVAGCSGGQYANALTQRAPGPVNLAHRMQGFAYILAGEAGVRANEDLRWYFSDDYVDWVAREKGGMTMVPRFDVQHLYPNAQMTPELHQICGEDAAKFLSLWGRMPW
jgi:hypothetical protein